MRFRGSDFLPSPLEAKLIGKGFRVAKTLFSSLSSSSTGSTLLFHFCSSEMIIRRFLLSRRFHRVCIYVPSFLYIYPPSLSLSFSLYYIISLQPPRYRPQRPQSYRQSLSLFLSLYLSICRSLCRSSPASISRSPSLRVRSRPYTPTSVASLITGRIFRVGAIRGSLRPSKI